MDRGDYRAGSEDPQAVVSIVGNENAALYEAGFAHMVAGRRLDAEACLQQVLLADPRHADAMHLLGLLALQGQQIDLAMAWLERVRRQSSRADYLGTLSVALKQAGRFDEAVQVIETAIQLEPNDPLPWLR